MENKVDWKVGDRVMYKYKDEVDTGTIDRIDTDGLVWARWDSDGLCANFRPSESGFTKMNSEPIDESAETKAVKLLLSLGYTLKKGV
jgi:hypothetical protein